MWPILSVPFMLTHDLRGLVAARCCLSTIFEELTNNRGTDLCKSRYFVNLLVWDIIKQFWNNLELKVLHYTQMESIQDSCQSYQEWLSQQIYPNVRLCNAAKKKKKCKSYISDHTGLTKDVKCYVTWQNNKKMTEQVWYVWKSCQEKPSPI